MAGFPRIPILADRIAAYRQAVRTGAMAPDWRLSYGVSMIALGVAIFLFTYAATQHPSFLVQRIREWHIPLKALIPLKTLLVGSLGFTYVGAFVVSLALDPRTVARRMREHNTHHKQVT